MTYPPHLPPPARLSGLLERVPPAAQAGISAALLLPTIVLYIVNYRFGTYFLDGASQTAYYVWNLGTTALVDVYFVIVVAVLARPSSRRVPAILLAFLAMILDLGSVAAIYMSSFDSVVRWIYVGTETATWLVYVAAWGVARRRRSAWWVGLVPSFVLGLLILLMYRMDWAEPAFGSWSTTWSFSWVFSVGALAVCCAICWALDGASAARPSLPPYGGRPGPGSYPPPGYYPPPGNYPPPGYPHPGGAPSAAGQWPPPGSWSPSGGGNPW